MPSFAVRHPYLLVVVCLFVCVLGLTSVARMPVDMFPPINIPVVLVATFYSGMPPQQIEADITVQDEGVQPLNLDFDADLVGITAITGTALRAYRIADELRAKGHTVVLGGVHPTLMPEEAALACFPPKSSAKAPGRKE